MHPEKYKIYRKKHGTIPKNTKIKVENNLIKNLERYFY
jgi:hypothetical protein